MHEQRGRIGVSGIKMGVWVVSNVVNGAKISQYYILRGKVEREYNISIPSQNNNFVL